MKALVGAFNQEKALVGAFSVIVQPVVEPMDRFTALIEIQTITGQVNGLGVSAGGARPDTRHEPVAGTKTINSATGGILMTQSYNLYLTQQNPKKYLILIG